MGDHCQTKTAPLVVDELVTGYVDQNDWNFYTFVVNSQFNVEITVQQTKDAEDCDLYVKLDNIPSRWDYDYLDMSPSKKYTLVIPDVVGRTLHIGVYGWTSSEYNLTVQITGTCVPQCVHGQCISGVCVCDDAWSGPDCNAQHVMIQSGIVVNGVLNQTNDWRYYHFKSLNATTFIISLKEEGFESTTVGALYLLVTEGFEEPTLRRYDYMDIDLNKGFHTLTITLDNRPDIQQLDWTIGVYASVFVTYPVPYKLLAWQPPPL